MDTRNRGERKRIVLDLESFGDCFSQARVGVVYPGDSSEADRDFVTCLEVHQDGHEGVVVDLFWKDFLELCDGDEAFIHGLEGVFYHKNRVEGGGVVESVVLGSF